VKPLSENRYQLIDFGNGRKLESLGDYRIIRPSPAADASDPVGPADWKRWDARYDASQRRWEFQRPWPERLLIDCGPFVMPVRPTPFGHIGLFPEQSDNWQWLAARPAAAGEAALNLFGYTGASTLALVSSGYHVAHVDAAKPNVQALRTAAELNGWQGGPIRYLVDDAAKFTAREVRRKRRYHTIVLDPPAYGHGPSGKAWRLQRDLWPLFDSCLQLLEADHVRLLITGHSPEVDADDVIAFLRRSELLRRHRDGGGQGLLLQSGRSQLTDLSGRHLDAGFFVRLAIG